MKNNKIMIINNVRGYQDENGVAQLNLEDVSRGLGFTENKSGVEYIKWRRVREYLLEFGFATSGENEKLPEYIPENIFYKLCFKAKNEIARKFQDIVTDEVLPSIRRTGSYDIDTNGLMKQLTQSQITLNNVFAGFKMQIDKGFEETNSKLNEHDELLKKRVYLSPKEAKDIQVAIKNKAKAIAFENDLPYHKVKGKLFKRLYTKLNEDFEVATYRELPSIRYEDIINTISSLNIPIRDIQNEEYQLSL
jgi:prophage antirepressor-like protein